MTLNCTCVSLFTSQGLFTKSEKGLTRRFGIKGCLSCNKAGDLMWLFWRDNEIGGRGWSIIFCVEICAQEDRLFARLEVKSELVIFSAERKAVKSPFS